MSKWTILPNGTSQELKPINILHLSKSELKFPWRDVSVVIGDSWYHRPTAVSSPWTYIGILINK